ncbi:MAG TPA: methyltransferase domain-containing protein [Tahibacter sp.]|nr:methyltransferase domain-containing protein [Tahibacter sp.]
MAALRTLFAQEHAALAPECAGVFGRQGLFIGCEPEFAEQMVTPMLGRRVALHLHSPGRLVGDAVCAPDELPFPDDSFRLVVLHHAFEGVTAPAMLRDELVRVLEPGGVALIVGFARFGAWRPWLVWQTRGQVASPQLASAGAWRRALARSGVDVYAERRIGAERLNLGGAQLRLPPALRSSWLLLARKRSTNALLRTRPVALRARPVRAPLASGTQRASA